MQTTSAMTLDWSRDVPSHHPQIDTTHQEFIELVEQVHRHARAHESAAAMALFRRLLEHTEAHFAQEERWMAASAYPQADVDAHCTEHRRVLQLIRDVLWRYEVEGGAATLVVVLEGLVRWFGEHAEGVDAQLARHLQATAPGDTQAPAVAA